MYVTNWSKRRQHRDVDSMQASTDVSQRADTGTGMATQSNAHPLERVETTHPLNQSTTSSRQQGSTHPLESTAGDREQRQSVPAATTGMGEQEPATASPESNQTRDVDQTSGTQSSTGGPQEAALDDPAVEDVSGDTPAAAVTTDETIVEDTSRPYDDVLSDRPDTELYEGTTVRDLIEVSQPPPAWLDANIDVIDDLAHSDPRLVELLLDTRIDVEGDFEESNMVRPETRWLQTQSGTLREVSHDVAGALIGTQPELTWIEGAKPILTEAVSHVAVTLVEQTPPLDWIDEHSRELINNPQKAEKLLEKYSKKAGNQTAVEDEDEIVLDFPETPES